VRRRLFEPFGKVLNTGTSTEPHDTLFTGQRLEEGTGLYDFQQRWYDPDCGRFMGVDPVIQNSMDPQTVNSYGYVRNDPANRVDPSGAMSIYIPNLSRLVADAIAGRGDFQGKGAGIRFGNAVGAGGRFGAAAAAAAPAPVFGGAGGGAAVQFDLGSGTSGQSLEAPGGSIAKEFANKVALLRAEMDVLAAEVGIGSGGPIRPMGSFTWASGPARLAAAMVWSGIVRGMGHALGHGFATGGIYTALEELLVPLMVIGYGVANVIFGGALLLGAIPSGPVGPLAGVTGTFLIANGVASVDAGLTILDEVWGTEIAPNLAPRLLGGRP
jgi:RHS repeat-associated protein